MSKQFLPTDRVVVRGKTRGVIRRLGFGDKVHVAVEGSTAPMVVSRYEIEHDDGRTLLPYQLGQDQQAEYDAMGENLRNLYDELRGDVIADLTHDEAMEQCALVANVRGWTK